MSRLWPFAAIALFVAALFAPALAEGRLLAPGDGLAQYFPLRVLASRSLLAGELPFWNPFAFSGMPLLAALQAGALFPGNWPFLALPPAMAMNVTVIQAYAVAGLGAFAFGRSIGMPALAAVVTALVAIGGGFTIAHLEHVVFIQIAGLVPWLLFAIERHRATTSRAYAGLGAAVLALMLLAGHPQPVVLGLLLAIPYALWRSRGVAATRPHAAGLAAMGLFGSGLALALLLPAWELFQASDRRAIPFAMLVDHALPPRQLVTFLFPFAFGSVPSPLVPTPYWGAGPWRNELIGYCGLATLVLATVAVAGWRSSPQARFWSVAAAAALLLALGDLTPLYQLWAHVPVLNAMRVPGRHLLELQLALAVLAGLGLTRLLESRRSAFVAWAAWGVPVFAVLAGVWRLGPGLAARWQPFMPEGVDLAAALTPGQAAFWLPAAFWLGLGLALVLPASASRLAVTGLLSLDLWLFAQAQGWRQLSPPVTIVPAAVDAMSPARTLSIAASPYPYFDPPLVSALAYPVFGALAGVRAIGGYDPFVPARYAAAAGGMSHGGVMADSRFWAPQHHVLDLLAGRELRIEATLLEDPLWHARLETGRFRRVAASERIVRYENLRALPQAWRPTAARVLTPEAIARHVAGEAPFDPASEALLESELTLDVLAPGTARTERLSLNRLAVTSRSAGPGLVVVSEGYDPGWTAWLADRRLPVHRVDGVLLGVEVPPGDHRFELRYEPRLWPWGLAGSALALVGLAAWLLGGRRRRRP